MRLIDFKDIVALVIIDRKAKKHLECTNSQLLKKHHHEFDEVPHVI